MKKKFWILIIIAVVISAYLFITNNIESNTSYVTINKSASYYEDAIKGNLNATVTIIEYSDYECPYCIRFYDQTMKLIDEKYIQTGKVKMIFKDFPLSFHKDAQKAAEAAECAGEQNKYWEMNTMLFENGVTGGVKSFKKYAKDLNLNQEDFDACLDSGIMYDEIKQDISEGKAKGIKGTPAFFINDKFISGAQPFSVFESIIDEELKNEN